MAELSLLPDEFNFLFWQGDTLSVEFTLLNPDNTPVDLTQYTNIKSQLRDASGALITDLVIVQTALATGIFETFLPATPSGTLQPGQPYIYDIQLEGTKLVGSTIYPTVITVAHGIYQVEKETTLPGSTRSFQVVESGERPSHVIRRRGAE